MDRGAWRLRSMGLQRVGHNWVSNKHFTFKMSQVLCYVLKSCLNCVWLFETPWTVTHQVPLCTGSSRQEYWSGLSCPSRGDLPNPGIKHWPFLHWQAESLPLMPSSISSVQFSHSVMSDFRQPHGLQHTRLPCPPPTPRAYSNSCLQIQSCHPTISSSVFPFSPHLQFFPAPGSFPVNQFFTLGSQSIGVSTPASDIPMNIQDWFPLG